MFMDESPLIREQASCHERVAFVEIDNYESFEQVAYLFGKEGADINFDLITEWERHETGSTCDDAGGLELTQFELRSNPGCRCGEATTLFGR